MATSPSEYKLLRVRGKQTEVIAMSLAQITLDENVHHLTLEEREHGLRKETRKEYIRVITAVMICFVIASLLLTWVASKHPALGRDSHPVSQPAHNRYLGVGRYP